MLHHKPALGADHGRYLMNQGSAVLPRQPPSSAGSYDDEIDLRELIGVISAGRWLVVAVVLLCISSGAFYCWAATRIFDADALVQVEAKGAGVNAALGELADVMGQASKATAEIELLKSRYLVGSVVDGLGLTIQATPRYFPIIGRPLARGADADGIESWLPRPPGGWGGYAWGGEFIRVTAFEVPPNLLTREFTLVATASGYLLELDGDPILRGQVGQREVAQSSVSPFPIEIFVQQLNAATGTRFRLTKLSRSEAIENVQSEISVSEKGKDSGILQLSYSADDPALAREVVNRLVIAYQRQNVERKSQEAAQTLSFLERQLPELRSRVESAERSFNNFRLKEGSADLTKETELILQQSVQLETKRVELDQQRQAALLRFTANHPNIQAIDRQMEAVQREQEMIGRRVKDLPETQQELLRLSREVQVNTTLYTNLLNSYQELEIVKAGTIGNVRIVDYAVDAREPSKPKIPLILALSLVLGVFLGIAAVFVRRALNPAVEDPAEVERVLGVPTYATVPYTVKQRAFGRSKSSTDVKLLALSSPQDIAIEAIRSLRTSLHFAMMDAPNNVLMLTGPAPDIGKSFVSVNLAAVLAMSGKRVVMVDADLRRGHANEVIGCERTPGISDYCAQQADLDQIIRPTAIDGLDLVPTGRIPPNPAELLLTTRFSELMEILSRTYDYVVVDTPPVLAVTDAAIVGKMSGCTMIVLKAGEHPMGMIQETVARLQNAGVAVKGTIFNQIGRSGSAYYYRYGYQYGYAQRYQSIST
ncbi:polysaccharide biosynthesis tyrosine autokinase [Fontimonas sp. SYSU GA230001]|uniref:polysaccharide biosynthesis tyrosine autokinase n=1 Tax=Fontimonas sp. SYSU GA230001 TaxID=3142450 RepID=UPI0032B33010